MKVCIFFFLEFDGVINGIMKAPVRLVGLFDLQGYRFRIVDTMEIWAVNSKVTG